MTAAILMHGVEKMLKHYESLGIDARNKTLLFSDSLDF